MSYPDDPAARVLALVEGEGYSASKAAEIVGVPGRTARMWVRNAMPLTADNKPILDKWRRRVGQALDLIEDGLDKIEEDDTGQAALKNLTTLNIIAGTGTDKLQKEKEQSQPRDLTQIVFVLNAQQPIPDYIEGEVKDA